MHIQFNDSPMQLDDALTITALLQQLDQLKPGAALALNQQILPRERWEEHIVQDGERVTKFVTVHVTGGRTEDEAKKAAEAVAKSSLVKSSWNGNDPNWGRILAAVGYAGGATPNPTYEEICTGGTGHAEVVQVVYDPEAVTYEALLKAFWEGHDPTQGMRQGNDVGTQYRSVIYYFNAEQQQQAQRAIEALQADGLQIVTELSPTPVFYPAEDYHQNFFARNPSQGYCNFAIPPKLMKLRSKFQDLLKPD